MSKNYDQLFKIILIGDSGVGKTCVLCRFANDEFNKSHISTIGIDFKMKTILIDGKRIRIQMWDTAGQERYETITTQYYRRAQGIILVYDITRLDTFQNIKKWLRYVDEHANNNVQKLLIGNKCDIESERIVAKESGMKLAAERNIQFYETSAYSNVNIDEAFKDICKQIIYSMEAAQNLSNEETMVNGHKNNRTSAIFLDTKREVLNETKCCS